MSLPAPLRGSVGSLGHDEPGARATSETCFYTCSPIRSRCPGPAAQWSPIREGRWTAMCRNGVRDSAPDGGRPR